LPAKIEIKPRRPIVSEFLRQGLEDLPRLVEILELERRQRRVEVPMLMLGDLQLRVYHFSNLTNKSRHLAKFFCSLG
jgi:hypothetical protein